MPAVDISNTDIHEPKRVEVKLFDIKGDCDQWLLSLKFVINVDFIGAK
jgi:hypothetical protein